jgi:methanogen extracellular protein (TIGR04279 family)
VNRTGIYNGIFGEALRLTLTFLTLIFLLSSVSAAFPDDDPWIAVIEKNGSSVYFADHSDNLNEGGWILLRGGNNIQLPQPLNFTYKGTDNIKSAGANIELKSGVSEKETKITLTYPYTTHPFYTENDKINVDYKGSAVFGKQKVNIYLVEGVDLNSLDEALTKIRNKDHVKFKEVFDNSTNSTTLITNMTLNKKGDLPSSLNLGPLPAGSYGLLIMLAGEENEKPESERTVLSATCFEVLEYELRVKSPNVIKEDGNLDVNLNLRKVPGQGKEAPDYENYTYGALLIREEAYCAEINANSNGTRAGTSIFVNGIDIIEKFDINSTNYKSKLSKDELTTEIQTLIGEGNGTVSIGEKGQNTLSLTTLDLPSGKYLLFAGAYEKGNGLVGIVQTKVYVLEVKKLVRSSKNQEQNNDLSAESQYPSALKTEQPVLDTDASIPFGLEDLESQIRGEALQEAAVEKNPPKMASFLAGFIGTLLIGIAVIKRRR